MSRCLEQLRCPHDHEHSTVSGTFRDSQGKTKRVSEYTELYARTFVHKIAKAMIASLKIEEKACIHQHVALHESTGDGESSHSEGPEVKRRRLNAKTSNPPAYPNPPGVDAKTESSPRGVSEDLPTSASVADIFVPRRKDSTSCWKRLCWKRGEFFEHIQLAFPQYEIRVVELCKGTDRLRKPPIRLMPKEAPWRLSMGLHRHQLEPVDLGQWMQWEHLSNRQLTSQSPPLRLFNYHFLPRSVTPIKLERPKHVPLPDARVQKLSPPFLSKQTSFQKNHQRFMVRTSQMDNDEKT